MCYIFHLMIPLLCKTWFYKDCNRNWKNPVLDVIITLGTSNQAILQPPKYLLLFVNRFWYMYINNNVTKDRCSISMDTTVRLGPLRFSLRPTIDHHGPSIHSGHYTASINCCKKLSVATITRLRSLEIFTTKNPLLHMLNYINWLTHDFGLEQEGGSLIAPMALAHPLHPMDNRSRNRRWNLWVGWCVSSWWPLFPSRSSVLLNIYIYMYMYICICIYALLYELCFLWFTNCALLSDDNSLIPGCLWFWHLFWTTLWY